MASSRNTAPLAFRDPGKALALLHRLGALRIEVDTAAWAPNSAGGAAPRRPDTAERQRRAHAAAMHDAWFRAEVEKALAEADSPDAEWVANEAVVEESRRLRDQWREVAKAG